MNLLTYFLILGVELFFCKAWNILNNYSQNGSNQTYEEFCKILTLIPLKYFHAFRKNIGKVKHMISRTFSGK